MGNYVKGGIIEKKVDYVRWILKKDNDMIASDIYKDVKLKFGTGIDGCVTRDLIREVRPHYKGHFNKVKKCLNVTIPELNSEKRVKITNIYKSFSKYGIHVSVISAAVRDAIVIPIVKVKFNELQISRIEKRLETDRVACVKLTKGNKVEFVRKENIHISDKRAIANKKRVENSKEV